MALSTRIGSALSVNKSADTQARCSLQKISRISYQLATFLTKNFLH